MLHFSIVFEGITCDIAHAETVNVDDVVQGINQHDEAKRVQIDESLHESGGGHHHPVAIQQPSERSHLPRGAWRGGEDIREVGVQSTTIENKATLTASRSRRYRTTV